MISVFPAGPLGNVCSSFYYHKDNFRGGTEFNYCIRALYSAAVMGEKLLWYSVEGVCVAGETQQQNTRKCKESELAYLPASKSLPRLPVWLTKEDVMKLILLLYLAEEPDVTTIHSPVEITGLVIYHQLLWLLAFVPNFSMIPT